ncbi:hypothetical protein [Microbacterium sp. SORGH_AS_0888]|uniref:hypothetical protein n=1 Tax=Microbacterium sp. SORGH_AS_0888 TaxID=3041791 RepID=UPI002783B0D0|nr:hypothetical protein [Microbacterium sp. SORGH_AS_0888]MDQ1129547.1 hypothetical protein [Microbacterium sp. SORGH_AS_0888]
MVQASPLERARPSWRLLTTATVFGAVTIALIWSLAVPYGVLVCAADSTACYPQFRAGSGVIASCAVAVLLAGTVTVGMFAPRLRGIIISGVAVLGAAPLVTYVAISYSPGFELG